MQNPLWGLGSFGPSIAGIIIIALVRGKEGLKGLWLRLLDWRVKLKWYVFIILFPPLIIFMAFFIHQLGGGTIPVLMTTESLALLVPTFFLVLVLGGPLNELPIIITNNRFPQAFYKLMCRL